MKWEIDRIWALRIVDPRLSRTTLKPRETTKRRKKEREFLPASRIATTKRKIVDAVPFPCALRYR